ncbi:hypothetical protein DERF_012936 [Dermatophagoides farinae]|uniref:Uncharacterized protein n=1 Tax=Dermatophagoides farinae TaxID=6954 RepID=A0A922HUG6_DERFA|nr:hypothetical protein DERF_012936 [Dermatophagoides farinae]
MSSKTVKLLLFSKTKRLLGKWLLPKKMDGLMTSFASASVQLLISPITFDDKNKWLLPQD